MLKMTALFIASVLITFALAEAIVRHFAPQHLVLVNNKEIWRADSTLGWRNVENTNTVVNTGDKTVTFVTDPNGFRINRHGKEKTHDPRSDFNIITIGDSFIQALQVENEETIPQVLRRELDATYPSKRKSSMTALPVGVRIIIS